MPCNKTIKLIWRRDLQREKKISKENKHHHPDQTYLLDHLRPPSSPFSASPSSRFFPQKQEYPYATSAILSMLFFPFHVWVILNVSVRLVKWSQFRSSHLYYEKY